MFCRKEGMRQAKQWLRVLGSADGGGSADGIEEKWGVREKNRGRRSRRRRRMWKEGSEAKQENRCKVVSREVS